MTLLEVETYLFGVTPAMLKIIAAVTVASIALGIIQRVRHEVGA